MISNDLLLRCLNGDETERDPVWFMRQAGRYLPDYMKLKERYDFFERVRNPELATEITVMPVDQVGVDAAILFSDILVISQALGHEVNMVPGKGPVIDNPIKNTAQVEAEDPSRTEEELAYAIPTIQAVKEGLSNRVPLIGFCGAPWTLLCYMVEGKGSKDFASARAFCLHETEAAHLMLQKITDSSIIYLKMQIEGGVDALQVFDSWAGLLDKRMYNEFALPYIKQMVEAIKKEVPTIVFARGAWNSLKELADCGPQALGLDWCTDPDYARSLVGDDIVLQGNLDPAVLLGNPATVARETRVMMNRFGKGKHIINLGHGVLPQTKVEAAKAFVQTAKDYYFEL